MYGPPEVGGPLSGGVAMLRFCTFRAPLLVLMALAGFQVPSAAQAQKLSTEVISPRLGLLNPLLPSSLLPKETSGGWPLTIRLTSNNEIGIGTASSPPFPEDGKTGFLIFTDPDGCPSFSPAIITNPASPCFNAPVDETFFEFTNDTDLVGVPDQRGKQLSAGRPDRLLRRRAPVHAALQRRDRHELLPAGLWPANLRPQQHRHTRRAMRQPIRRDRPRVCEQRGLRGAFRRDLRDGPSGGGRQ